jgi:type I restriction enzyme M protein
MPPTTYTNQLSFWDEGKEGYSRAEYTSSDKTLLFLGLLLLRYLDDRIIEIGVYTTFPATSSGDKQTRDTVTSRGAIYLPSEARFSHLVSLIGSLKIGRVLNDAIRLLESESINLKGVIPRAYHQLDRSTLVDWLKTIASVPKVDNTSFVEIYLHLMNKCCVVEYEETHEWSIPKSIIETVTRILTPHHEHLTDAECGTGAFLRECDALLKEAPLRRTILANSLIMKGLAGVLGTIGPPLPFSDLFSAIRQGDGIYEPIRQHFGTIDTVICNPPFNIRNVDKSRLKSNARFPFGLPHANNSNYIFIQIIYSALAPGGRGCFLMADAASDAGGSEREVRRKLIKSGTVDVMVSLGMNAFGKARVPCTLWILDKGKTKSPRRDQVLFIDAQCLNRQAVGRDGTLTEGQLKFLNQIVRLYRGELPAMPDGNVILKEYFPDGRYKDVNSLCRGITITEIGKNGWSLNPRLYLRGEVAGASRKSVDALASEEGVQAMEAELEKLDERAAELEKILQEQMGELDRDELHEVGEGTAIKSVPSTADTCRELIQINIRRSAIFESQALSLYRDWFVSFKYPGHEGCEMVISAFGDVPVGWQPTSVGNLANLFVGNKAEEDKNYEKITVIKQPCIRDAVVNLALAKMYQARIKRDRRLLVSDILVNAVGIGTLGRVAQVNEALSGHTVDSHICVVRPREYATANYLGLALLNLQTHFAGLGTGSTGKQRLRKDTIANTAILLPPEKILNKFNQEVLLIRDHVIPPLMQNANLLHNREP